MDASSKQTQSSSDALQEYQESHGGNMPTSVTLVNYSGNSPKSVSIENSGFVEIVSSGAVVVPAGQRSVPQYIEVLELKVPGEKPIISKRKISIAGGGGFEQSYKYTLTKEFPQGMYTYSTRVMTKGGQVLGERNGSFRVI